PLPSPGLAGEGGTVEPPAGGRILAIIPHSVPGEVSMADPQIDLKALLVEHEDCDAGTVQKLRTGLAQGGGQFRSLREVTEALAKRLEAGQGNPKKIHLKLGIAYYFLGYMEKAAEHLQHADTALGA